MCYFQDNSKIKTFYTFSFNITELSDITISCTSGDGNKSSIVHNDFSFCYVSDPVDVD